MLDIEKLVADSLRPSWFVRHTRTYRMWCSIVVCPDCKVRAKYEDMHPVDPCPFCGSKNLREQVGMWIELYKPWWKVWEKQRGYWLLREEYQGKEKL